MSDAASAASSSGASTEAAPNGSTSVAGPANAPAPSSSRVQELRVSGNLMTLDAGLYCIMLTPSPVANPGTGLPGVRVSLPPGPLSRPEAVSIASFRPDGWLSGFGDAALVRVTGGPAHIMVSIYQAPDQTEGAPSLQVHRLLDPASGPQALIQAGQPAAAAVPGKPRMMDVLAHIQSRGDVGAVFGDWLGERGSKLWIEGFAIAPTNDIALTDIEYQAVLGRGWLSPWVEGGQFCGSRGMSLPVLGLKLRLRGEAAERFTCRYAASFIDGTEIGPVQGGEACESEALVGMEALRIEILPREGATQEDPAADPKPARRR